MTEYSTYTPFTKRYGGATGSSDPEASSNYSLIVYPGEKTPAAIGFTERDADTLAAFLRPVELSPYSSVAEQVFGSQARQSRVSLEHMSNLMYERARIHKRHSDEIERRHMELQGQLFGAQLHAKLDNHKRELTVQSALLGLDADRRKEELAFWKDSSDIRENLFIAAKDYQASRHRASFLERLESGNLEHA